MTDATFNVVFVVNYLHNQFLILIVVLHSIKKNQVIRKSNKI